MLKSLIFFLLLFHSVYSFSKDEFDNKKSPLRMELQYWENSATNHHYEISISNDQSENLRSLIIGLPCGKVSNFHNSENWPVQFGVLDRSSGIYGFRLINNRSVRQNKTITISFDITALGDYCTNIFETWRPKLAYMYGSKLYRETLGQKPSDIPSDIDYDLLPQQIEEETIHINTYFDQDTNETVFDILSRKNEQIVLELYNLSGIKTSTMFIGSVKEGIRNLITFNYDILPDKNYIYKISSSMGDMYGKLSLPK